MGDFASSKNVLSITDCGCVACRYAFAGATAETPPSPEPWVPTVPKSVAVSACKFNGEIRLNETAAKTNGLAWVDFCLKRFTFDRCTNHLLNSLIMSISYYFFITCNILKYM